MQLGRMIITFFDGGFLYPQIEWEDRATRRVPETGALLYDDISEEPPFWAVKSGNNRIARVTKMLELGFISINEARALLGGTA